MEIAGKVSVCRRSQLVQQAWAFGSVAVVALVAAQFAHATPILDSAEAQSSQAPAVTATVLTKKAAAPTLLASTEELTLGLDQIGSVEHIADANNCDYSVLCYETVQVPEPRSLILVGSGLLSMFGLFRRRLLQR